VIVAASYARGDTIRFTDGLTEELRTIYLQCVYAKPFDGSHFVGTLENDGDTVLTTDTPRGPGIPDWYDTATNRLAMDRAAFVLDGFLAGQISDYLASGTINDLTVEVTNHAVFPPFVNVASGIEEFTDYDIEAWLDGAPISPADYVFDLCNGYIRIDRSAVSESGAISIVNDADGGDAWMITRENRLPAEILTNMDRAVTALQWCEFLPAFSARSFTTTLQFGMTLNTQAQISAMTRLQKTQN